MKMSSVPKIIQIVLMSVGFFFKTDVEIGLCPIAVLEEEAKPFDSVPDEERQIEEFALLCRVDQFVV